MCLMRLFCGTMQENAFAKSPRMYMRKGGWQLPWGLVSPGTGMGHIHRSLETRECLMVSQQPYATSAILKKKKFFSTNIKS